ncbi:MAG: hypothetical protein QOG84_637 [Sphingomonadales bacterium]|jgi:hypothetical protein|nr:hypothetical protein [Sphingomonadales bacterium]
MLSRIALGLAGIVVATSMGRDQLAPAAAIVLAAYLGAGEHRLALRLATTITPIILFSGILWLLVDGITLEWTIEPMRRLIAANANFLSLLRALVGSSAIVLAFATVPDGEALVALRQLRIPAAAATVLAAGATMGATVAENSMRSITALRAQGFLAPGKLALLRRLGSVAALTWTTSLSEVVARAEGKWGGNGFLTLPPPQPIRDRPAAIRGSCVLFSTAVVMGLLMAGAGR